MWNRKGKIFQIRKGKKLNKQGLYAVIASVTVLVLLVVASVSFVLTLWKKDSEKTAAVVPSPFIREAFIEPNEYSRPGTALKEIHGIVVHYTANPGTGAMANRNYFNNLTKINKRKQNKTYASSHFVIGIEGEVVQCVPLDEIAYASNERNSDTISIECCHKRRNGKFTRETYSALVNLTAYLCYKYGLTEKNVIRHYDVTGKICPKYFVDHPDVWREFLSDVTKKQKSG